MLDCVVNGDVVRLVVGLAASVAARDRDVSGGASADVLLSLTRDGLSAVGTDGVARLTTPALSVTECRGVGRVAVPAARIVQVLDALRGAGPVALKAGGKDGRVLTVKAGKTEYKLQCGEVEDFPPAKDEVTYGAPVTLGAVALSDALGAVIPAVSDDVNRLGLNGAAVEHVAGPDGRAAGALRWVGTDGSRLTWAEVIVDAPVDPGAVRVPRTSLFGKAQAAALRQVIRGNGDPDGATVTLAWGPRHLRAEVGGVVGPDGVRAQATVVEYRMIDGQFPDYRLVLLPEASIQRTVTVDGGALAAGLSRVGLCADDKNSSIRVALNEGRIGLAAVSLKAGSAQEEVDAEVDGPPLSTGFNARYLADAIKAAGAGPVTLRLRDALDPVAWSGARPGVGGVVMPMRLD
jgi:DNA polymerase-3 subunit beta